MSDPARYLARHPTLLDFLEREEGLRLEAYLDSAGVLTIGYGHTGGVQPGDEVTEEEARRMLAEDALTACRAVFDAWPGVPLTVYQAAALASLAYNIGGGRLRQWRAYPWLAELRYEDTANAFWVWRRAGGELSNGLVLRREREAQLFRTMPMLVG